jgi:uncharacterized damage-inducible protein DinB
MTYYGGKELAASFRTVRENTIQIAEDIPENKYDFKPVPDSRSVAQMLAHIALSSGFQTYIHSNKMTDMATANFGELGAKWMAEESKPRTKAELIALLKDEGEKFTTYLESLPEAFLGEPVTQWPGSQPAIKSRFEMLISAKEHEMHHRGQLMLVERMLGIVPHLTRRMQERMAERQAQAAAGER